MGVHRLRCKFSFRVSFFFSLSHFVSVRRPDVDTTSEVETQHRAHTVKVPNFAHICRGRQYRTVHDRPPPLLLSPKLSCKVQYVAGGPDGCGLLLIKSLSRPRDGGPIRGSHFGPDNIDDDAINLSFPVGQYVEETRAGRSVPPE